MMKSVYVYYDKEVKAYGLPQFNDFAPAQFKEGLTRAILKGFEVSKLSVFVGQSVYYLGTFDDNTGELFPVKQELVIDCDPIIKEREARENEKLQKEVKEDA